MGVEVPPPLFFSGCKVGLPGIRIEGTVFRSSAISRKLCFSKAFYSTQVFSAVLHFLQLTSVKQRNETDTLSHLTEHTKQVVT